MADELLFDNPAAVYALPATVLVVSNLGPMKVQMDRLKNMLQTLRQLSPGKVLPGISSGVMKSDFNYKLVGGFKIKTRFPAESWAGSQAKQFYDNAGDGAALKTGFQSLMDANHNTETDFGFHFEFCATWDWEQMPKVPIAGPFVMGGLEIKIEAGIKVDVWFSDFGLGDGIQSWDELEQLLINDWLDDNPSGGGN